MSDNSITIQLPFNRNIQLEDENVVHRKEINEVKNIIEDDIKYAVDFTKKIWDSKSPDEIIKSQNNYKTITILGQRGSGKTTFLQKLQASYKSNQDLAVLDIIDPTLVEEKGHIFLTVVSVIKDMVELELSKVSNEKKITSYKEWENICNALAGGIPSIDGIGKTMQEADWQDSQYIMDKGLKSVHAAWNLKVSFCKFITTALKHLNKKCFFIIFDDIDIDFRKGWLVLDMIRKYFLFDNIITVVSGDERLYLLGIRKRKWKNFGKELLINEGELLNKVTEYNDLVTEMEGQYLLKVLRPERRIRLSSLYTKTRLYTNAFKYSSLTQNYSEDSLSKIKIQVKDVKTEVTEFYISLFKRFGIANRYQSDPYISFLLQLPLRTQIEFLTQFVENQDKLGEMDVIDPFLSDLIEKSIDINTIQGSSRLLTSSVLKLLINEKELGDLYQLQPTTDDISLNSSLVSLNLLFTQKIAIDPFLIFDYFIKIGYVRNLLSVFSYDESPDSNINSSNGSIKGLCKHAGLYQDKVLRDVLGNMNAYLKGAFNSMSTFCGIIELPGLAGPSKQRMSYNKDRIDNVFKNAPREKQVLGYIPLSICAFSTKNATIPCYSVYTLLATISEILSRNSQNEIYKALLELSQIRTFLIPELRRSSNDANYNSAFFPEDDDLKTGNITTLTADIFTWTQSFPGHFAISPHLLGKISTRFFYALKSIENDEPISNLGDMMHYRIISLLNAILIEDVRENVEVFREFNVNNTKFSDKIFIDNLKAAIKTRSSLSFSSWILACPLLLSYLRPSRELGHTLSQFNHHIKFDKFIKNTVFHYLQEVSVKINQRIQKAKDPTKMGFDEITERLIEEKMPYSLFVNSPNRALTLENNARIRSAFESIFGVGDWDSGRLRKLREHIKKSRIKW